MILLTLATDLARLFNTTPGKVQAWGTVGIFAVIFIYWLVVILIAMHKNDKLPPPPPRPWWNSWW